jgi:hypothetical protein
VTEYIPDPNRPGSFIEKPITPSDSSPHYATVPLSRESMGAMDGFVHSPLLTFLAWARKAAGWDLSFADIACNVGVQGALRAAVGEWSERRRAMGFLHEETPVSFGAEGLSCPFVNPDVPAGHVLLMRKPASPEVPADPPTQKRGWR